MKIKKVEIAGFRAYQKREDGTFDFTLDSGEVANFVSIYAPNGFGKSSFYDAVEWAITNNINRFTRDSLRSNNDNISKHLNSGEDKHPIYILRNRDISDTDESMVSIDTTLGNKTFKRAVRNAGLGQRDFTFHPNSIVEGTKELTNIFLSQDAIDAFLKEETPEARYEKFMSHFGGDNEQYRRKLNALTKTCARERKLLNEQQQKLEETLNKHAVLEAFKHVNETIQKLRDTGETQISLLSPDTTNESTEPLYRNYLTQGQQQNSNALNQAKEKLVLIDNCITSLPSFIQKTNNALQSKKQIDNLQINQQLLDKRDQLLGLVAEYESRLNTSLKEKEAIDYYAVNLDRFIGEQSQLDDYKGKKIKLVREKSDYSTQLAVNKQSLEDKILAVSEININCDKYQKYIGEAADIFKQIDGKLSHQLKLTTELAGVTKELDAQLSQQRELEATRSKIGNMVVDQNICRLNEYALLKISENLTLDLANCLERLHVLHTELEQDKIKLGKLGILQGDIGKLVNIARELLTQTQSDTCPLCSYKHESYESLVAKILNNNGLSQQQKDIGIQIETRERELLQQSNILAKFLAVVDEFKKAKLQELTTKANELTNKISQNEQKQFDLKRNYDQLEVELHEIKLKTQGMSIQDYMRYCEEQINSFSFKKIELENDIEKLKKDEEVLTNKIADLSTKQASVDALITQLETSDITLKIQAYLAQNSVLTSQAKTFICQKVLDLEQSIKQIKTDIEQSKVQVAQQEQSITNKNGLFNREELLSQVEHQRHQLEDFNNHITDFKTQLHTLQIDPEIIDGTDEVISTELSQFRSSTQSAFSNYNQKEILFKTLESQLTDVLSLSVYLATKKELNVIEEELAKYTELNLKLQQELEIIGTRLKYRIDNFFYTELINKIYSKIDPHPSFKKVCFKCVFPSDSRPRLEVYLHEEDNSQPIAPSLFFSAAQLNVLSLSIFLARALHVEYKGKPVKTILIDDPIHSMDSINILSTIDLLRNISDKFDRQIILSTHDENFHELLKMKIPSKKYASKFMKLESFGKVMLSA